MIKLSKQGFVKAREYIMQNATPIDIAWYKYNFEHHDTKKFMEALGKYQFDNGGLGGLEFEIAYQGPCLKSTEHAFRYIYHLDEKPSSDHPLIKNMIKYILEKYRSEEGCWGDLFEPQVNDYAHVRWFAFENDYHGYDTFKDRIKYYNPNGHAGLAAFVALYSDIVPRDLYEDIIKYPIEKIRRYYDKDSPYKGTYVTSKHRTDEIESPYNMICLSQFCDCLKEESIADELKNILCQNPTACMKLDSKLWHQDYYETPCDIVSTPNFLYEAVKEEVDNAIDHIIKWQSDEGAWYLPWSLGSCESMKKLEAKHNVHLTVLIITQLKRFARI